MQCMYYASVYAQGYPGPRGIPGIDPGAPDPGPPVSLSYTYSILIISCPPHRALQVTLVILDFLVASWIQGKPLVVHACFNKEITNNFSFLSMLSWGTNVALSSIAIILLTCPLRPGIPLYPRPPGGP